MSLSSTPPPPPHLSNDVVNGQRGRHAARQTAHLLPALRGPGGEERAPDGAPMEDDISSSRYVHGGLGVDFDTPLDAPSSPLLFPCGLDV